MSGLPAHPCSPCKDDLSLFLLSASHYRAILLVQKVERASPNGANTMSLFHSTPVAIGARRGLTVTIRLWET